MKEQADGVIEVKRGGELCRWKVLGLLERVAHESSLAQPSHTVSLLYINTSLRQKIQNEDACSHDFFSNLTHPHWGMNHPVGAQNKAEKAKQAVFVVI